MEASSCQLDVAKHQIWYHYPVMLRDEPKLGGDEWTELDANELGTFDQRSYFHKFVADRLFGQISSDPGIPTFSTWVRTKNSKRALFGGDKLLKDDNGRYSVRRFRLAVDRPELRYLGKCRSAGDYRGIAVLSVRVVIKGVCETSSFLNRTDALEAKEFHKLPYTLTQAMCSTDWLRRVYARWWDGDLPGDSLCRVLNLKDDDPIHSDFRQPDNNKSLEADLFPWVAQLFAPIDFRGPKRTARIKGEERAYMSSVIALRNHFCLADGDRAAAATIAAIPDGDLLRLAEADPKVAGAPSDFYSPEFASPMKKAIFYDRHAPHPDAEERRATRYMITAQHLCAVSSGEFSVPHLTRHFDKYYRHMHFLCVFEMFRLLQFSEELTELVARYKEEGFPMDLGKAEDYLNQLGEIRHEFLNHTHLHHFSNVSSQIQPAEMFERLYDAFGIKKLHDEVEQELAAATSFSETVQARLATRRAERLNNIAGVGVPAGLGLALAGLWFQITGTDGFLAPPWLAAVAPNLWGAGMQLAGAMAIGFGLWIFATLSVREKRSWPRRETFIVLALLVATVCFGALGGCTNRNTGQTSENQLENLQIIDIK